MTEAFQEAEEPKIESTDEEEFELVEPVNATRLSPYAIASLATAFLAGFQSVSVIASLLYVAIEGPDVVARVVIRAFAPVLAPVGFAVAAIWLAGKGEDEIMDADGRLGGVGLCRAARIVSMIVIGILVVGAAMAFIFGRVVSPYR